MSLRLGIKIGDFYIHKSTILNFLSARVFDKIKTLFFICRLPEDSTLIHVFYSDLKVFKYSTQQLYSSYDILGKQFYTMTIYLLTVKIFD